MSWLLAGFPLLLIGHFTPMLTLLSVAVAAVLVPLGLRFTPGRSSAPDPRPARGRGKPIRTPWWAVAAALVAAPVLGAAAVVAFAGLTARLVGPRWAPLATLVLALSLPEQLTSRSTCSEPVAQILFLGGLCLVIDALDRNETAAGSSGRSAVSPSA
jgi:hypothetical protein